ncbi:hypothetical protein [Gallibacterium anatis]|uniref:Rz1-like lysis system protein LysC n=1 Tax=Gallibacterium anatis TaxID=750 RepID=UPI0012D3252A|nr:hypothetical protein [Gallibacterium anatis]
MLTVISLILCSTSCTTQTKKKSEDLTKYEKTIVYIEPPAALLSRCEKPIISGQKWRDLAEYAVKLQNALIGCDKKIELINEFIKRKNAQGTTQEK